MSNPFAASRKQTPRQTATANPREPDPLQDRFLAIVDRIDGGAAHLQLLYWWRDTKWESSSGLKFVGWLTPPSAAWVGSLWVVRLTPGGESGAVTGGSGGGPDVDPPVYQVRTSEGAAPEAAVEAFIERQMKLTGASKRASSLSAIPTSRQPHHTLDEIFPDLEDIRRLYFDKGRKLGFRPQESVYIGVRDLFALGPFMLSRDEATGNWKPNADSAIVPVFQNLTEATYQSIDVRGAMRVVLRYSSPPLRQIATADFRPDSVFLQDFLSKLGAPETPLPTLRRAVETFDLSRADSSAYQRRRTEEALNAVLEDQGLRLDTGRLLVQLPAARAIVEEQLASLRSDMEARLAEEHRGAAESVQRLLAEKESLTRATSALEGQRDGVAAELALLRAEKSDASAARIAQIAAAVAEAAKPATPAPHANYSAPPQSPMRPRADADAAAENGAVRTLKRRLAVVGIDPEAAEAFLAAVICGVPPVLIGPAACPLLSEISDFLFGGYAVQRTVTSLISECGDLFGRLHPASGTFRPDPDGLADAVLTADEGVLHLVAFDGFNRCESEAVFSPLKSNLRRAIPVMRPGSVRPEDPYACLATAVWPKSFVTAFLFSADGAPLPVRFWSQSAAIVASFTAPQKDLQEGRPVFLTPCYLAGLADAKRRDAASQLIQEDGMLSAAAWSSRFGGDFSGYLAALLALGVDAGRAPALAAQSLTAIPMAQAGATMTGVLAEGAERCREALDES